MVFHAVQNYWNGSVEHFAKSRFWKPVRGNSEPFISHTCPAGLWYAHAFQLRNTIHQIDYQGLVFTPSLTIHWQCSALLDQCFEWWSVESSAHVHVNWRVGGGEGRRSRYAQSRRRSCVGWGRNWWYCLAFNGCWMAAEIGSRPEWSWERMNLAEQGPWRENSQHENVVVDPPQRDKLYHN